MPKFYQECDQCVQGRSEEYGGLPSCRECCDSVCEACMEPGTEYVDVDAFDAVCKRCAALE